ncbi:MAG: hypothetical protein P4L86_26975 [Mycobacterium sp.]|nr:hypothetical protein [Mycobacterium sp.]
MATTPLKLVPSVAITGCGVADMFETSAVPTAVAHVPLESTIVVTVLYDPGDA